MGNTPGSTAKSYGYTDDGFNTVNQLFTTSFGGTAWIQRTSNESLMSHGSDQYTQLIKFSGDGTMTFLPVPFTSTILSMGYHGESNTLLIGTQFDGIYISEDFGLSFTQIAGTNNKIVRNFYIKSDGTAYIGFYTSSASDHLIYQYDISTKTIKQIITPSSFGLNNIAFDGHHVAFFPNHQAGEDVFVFWSTSGMKRVTFTASNFSVGSGAGLSVTGFGNMRGLTALDNNRIMLIKRNHTTNVTEFMYSDDLGSNFTIASTIAADIYASSYAVKDLSTGKYFWPAFISGGMVEISNNLTPTWRSVASNYIYGVDAIQYVSAYVEPPINNMHSLVDMSFFSQNAISMMEETTEIGTVVNQFFVAYDMGGVVFPDFMNDNQNIFDLPPGIEDNDLFELVAENGNRQINLATKFIPDYETKSSYTVQVRATDQYSNSIQQNFTIYVTNSHMDVNMAPADFFYEQVYPLRDNTQSPPSSRPVAKFLTSFNNHLITELDVDPTPPYTAGYYSYSLVDGPGGIDNHYFRIDDNCELRTEVSAVFNYAEKPRHYVRIKIQDPYGGSFEKVFAFDVVANVVALPSQLVKITSSGAAIASVEVNPMTVEVTVNGQPLPTGSVLRNTATNQKFVKLPGEATAFMAIELEPKNNWAFTPTGNAAWEILQAL
jgi:hypothetical protein